MNWYQELAKPSWAPQPQVFGQVWGVLYPIIFVTYGYVAFRVFKGEFPKALLVPIAINLLANLAFTPIQFGWRNLPLAVVDILIVLVTIVWSIVAFWPYSKFAALALVPYLVWVSIATVLQTSIWQLNR